MVKTHAQHLSLDRQLIDRLVGDNTAVAKDSTTSIQATLVLPIVKRGDTAKNPIRLKTSLSDAQKTLHSLAHAEGLAARIDEFALQPDEWEALRNHDAAWIQFSADHSPRLIPLAQPSSGALLYIGPRAYVRPLIQEFQQLDTAYVLCLTQNGSWMVRIRAGAVQPVDVEGLPLALQDVVGHDKESPSLQQHSAGASTMFHGQGINIDDKGPELRQYLQQVDALCETWRGKGSGPDGALFVAGVDELTTLYREMTSAPIAGCVACSPSPENYAIIIDQINDQIVRIRQDDARRRRAEWVENRDFVDEPVAIRDAAREGRLGQLMVLGSEPIWHPHADSNGDLVTSGTTQNPPGAVDLVDETLQHAWQTGTEITVAPHMDTSQADEPPMFGLLRY